MSEEETLKDAQAPTPQAEEIKLPPPPPALKERDLITCLKTLHHLAQDKSYRQHPRYTTILRAAQSLLDEEAKPTNPPQNNEAPLRRAPRHPAREDAPPIAPNEDEYIEESAIFDEMENAPASLDESAANKEALTHRPRMLFRRRCYACKIVMQTRHPENNAFCVACGDINLQKRHQSTDLSGRRAIVTGGRSKIGYATALKLLRAGAIVLVTTRFPKAAAERYANEADFSSWRERLLIHGLDLRSFPAIERFNQEAASLLGHLDILINNAAQTIRRPPLYYQPILQQEIEAFSSPDLIDLFTPSTRQNYLECRTLAQDQKRTPALPEATSPNSTILPMTRDIHDLALEAIPPAWREHASFLSGIPFLPDDHQAKESDFPPHERNRYGELADLRDLTSWEMEIDQIHPFELLEVHLINALAPFLLMRGLRPLMLQSPHPQRFLVNATSTEGQFSQLLHPNRTLNKSTSHPHTNMTKAALNMLTISGAYGDAKRGIFRTAVDPGWASIENARPIREHWFALGADAPITLEDAAARLCDPIFTPLRDGTPPLYGVLIKDYRIVSW
jgi:NAD(P)-dependent dehydrogenase (short-subunit alcohol dehydrogenase family)